MKKYRIAAMQRQGLFTILWLHGRKERIKIVETCLIERFERINSRKSFKVSSKRFATLIMYNCNFPTTFWAVVDYGRSKKCIA